MKNKAVSFVLVALFTCTLLCSCSSSKNAFIDSAEAEAPGNGGYDFYDVYTTQNSASEIYDGVSYNYKVDTYSATTGTYDVYEEAQTDVPVEEVTGDVSDDIVTRKIIYTSSYGIETKTFDESVAKLNNLCAKHGAYYERSNTYSAGGNARRANFTVRVPVGNYQAFIGEADSIGVVVSSSQNNKDVTENYFDTEARLESAKIREERVLEILKNSSDLDDVLALERELADIRYEIESYTGALRKYDSLINYSTVEINISEVQEYVAPKVEAVSFGERMGSAFGRGINEFKEGFENFLVFLSYNFIPLLIWVIIIVVIVIVVKVIIKKIKKNMRDYTQTSEDNDTAENSGKEDNSKDKE